MDQDNLSLQKILQSVSMYGLNPNKETITEAKNVKVGLDNLAKYLKQAKSKYGAQYVALDGNRLIAQKKNDKGEFEDVAIVATFSF